MKTTTKRLTQWFSSCRSSNNCHSRSSTMSNCANMSNNNTKFNVFRELGLVEKLLHSYGFLQCCDRQARLFFHFSEVVGDAEALQVGDMIEFQQSSDRRTGKPIAVSLMKLPSATVLYEIVSDKPVPGLVLSEAKPSQNRGSDGELSPDEMGRVTYEQSGETFFLPFTLEDIENGERIKAGDHVEFFISTDERNGTIRARKVKKIVEIAETYQGVICTLKDNYGFIERADAVKEIFFHFSEFEGDVEDLVLGDDVQFNIQTRNSKEVAVNIQRLPEGTVIFEDVAAEKRRGRIKKTLNSTPARVQSDPLSGRIVYETLQGSIEIPYGDRDQIGEYTLQTGDIVEFYIATDRRDKLQRATNISLVDVTFTVSRETREKGFVISLKELFGFIRCADKEARIFFHFTEMLDPEKEINLQDEVEFTVVEDPTNPSRQVAIRIKSLPKGFIIVNHCLPEKYTGSIEKEAGVAKTSANGDSDPDPGIIMYDVDGTKQTIPYSSKAIMDGFCPPKYGDLVEFQICECRKNNTKTAVNVRVTSPVNLVKEYGYIAALKESFGLIELVNHESEVFFHLNFFDGDPSDLDLGDEVEFTFSHKMAKVSAENVRKLAKGTLAADVIAPGILEGKVVRNIRIANPDQSDYSGIIQVEKVGSEAAPVMYSYGITSLIDKQDLPQVGELVKFQSVSLKNSKQLRAARIAPVRRYIHARVDSLKGQLGILNYEIEDGKKVTFSMSEVLEGCSELQVGDEVEFVGVKKRQTGKYSAFNLRKISDRQRPERLMSRLKSIGDELGPKLITIRQPRGPDGTKGFKPYRKLAESLSEVLYNR